MISLPKLQIGQKEKEYVIDCLNHNDIGTGKYVLKFEDEFAKYIGMSYATAVNNGTSALHLALTTLGISSGDEVLVPSFTFAATVEAIKYCNAVPVFIDCNLDDWCINVDLIKRAITSKTKAIIPVHIYGNPCQMDKIQKIARKNNLFIIEDAAEAHGSEYTEKSQKIKKCGSFSDISCFSFFCNKLMTTGEGGMCLTNNLQFKEKMDLLKSHGKEKIEVLNKLADYSKKQYYHAMLGYNYRMTNIQAAIGLGQLENIETVISQKRKIADDYTKCFKKMELDKHFRWQKEVGKSNFWLIGILCENAEIQDKLTRHLNTEKIETRSFFYPIHLHSFFPNNIICEKDKMKSISEDINERGIILPNDLSMTSQEIETVALKIKEFF